MPPAKEHRMILVDNELRMLQKNGTPIRVAIVGAGFMCQGLTNQIVNSVPGMRVVAISNRKVQRALDVYRYSGVHDVVIAETQQQLDSALESDRAAVTEDALLMARADLVDVIVDATGSVEFGA